MRLSGETPFPSAAVNPVTDLLLSACIKFWAILIPREQTDRCPARAGTLEQPLCLCSTALAAYLVGLPHLLSLFDSLDASPPIHFPPILSVPSQAHHYLHSQLLASPQAAAAGAYLTPDARRFPPPVWLPISHRFSHCRRPLADLHPDSHLFKVWQIPLIIFSLRPHRGYGSLSVNPIRRCRERPVMGTAMAKPRRISCSQ
jgi:hypothetical protein